MTRVETNQKPQCSVCGTEAPLMAFYGGREYCLACLSTEYPKIGGEIYKYFKEYLGWGERDNDNVKQ